jgi:cyclopropane-fatty-acyl-phospholipid synthase
MSATLDRSTVLSWGGEWLSKPLRVLVLKQLGKITYGCITVSEGATVTKLGTARDGEPQATIRVERQSIWERVVFGGTIGAAESYMDGDWSTDNLVSLVRIFCANRDVMESMEGGLAWLKWPALKVWHFARRDTIEQARKNISAHYDLGNEFFDAWLDPTMAYSCGIFTREDSTMIGASLRKIYTLCEKLQLDANDHLLEIGSGWGALAIFAASNYGCKVTTATISKNQFNHVRDEVRRLKLEHLVTPVFCDYRKLDGKFDKIVSVEMIEAVGHHYFDTYFEKVSSLLKPDGVAAIQAITIRDQAYNYAVRNVDFIQRYIFPGSTIPSVTRMMESVRDKTDMILSGFEDITDHYCLTLSQWRQAFWRAEPRLRAMGMNDHGLRMWDYYFAYCEGGFAEKVIGVCQFILSKPKHKTVLSPGGQS